MTVHPKIFRVTLAHEGVEVEYVKKSERDELLAALKAIRANVSKTSAIAAIADAAIARAEGR